MAVDNNHRMLAQYCAANVDRGESDGILDSLENVNYKIPMELPSGCYTIHGATPLHLASYYQNMNDFKNLIKRGADFTLKNGHGRTVLYHDFSSYCVYYQKNGYILRDEVKTDPYISIILSAHAEYNILENPCCEAGISHLHIACVMNHVEAVRTFLQNGTFLNTAIDVNSKILPGYTPLHIAARYCALETVEILLEHGADISRIEAQGRTVLHLLIERNMKIMNSLDITKPAMYNKLKADIDINEQIINMIVKKNGTRDCSGLSLLQIACTMQDPSRAEQLLANADLQYSVNKNSIMWPGYTALHFAAHFNINTVKLLLQYGANILAKDGNNVTPFDLCVKKYNIGDIYYLIDNERNLRKIKFSDDETKLATFVRAMQDKSTFESFIEKISDLSIYISFESPLWPGYTLFHVVIAFLEKDEDILENFIENTDYYYPNDEAWKEAKYENFNKKTEDESKEEIGKVEKTKLNLEDIKLCLKKGIEVTTRDIQGNTPLHLAFRLPNQNVVDLLLEAHKRTVNPIDNNNMSHLHIAVASGNRNSTLIKLLKANTTHINEPVKNSFYWYVDEWNEKKTEQVRRRFKIDAGSTALHIAIVKCDHQVAKLLISFGANIHARDKNDFTPFHLMIYFPEEFDSSGFREILDGIKILEDRVVKSIGLSHLHLACWFGNKNIVKNLLNQASVNTELAITVKDSMPYLKDEQVKNLKEVNNMRPLGVTFVYMWLDVIELLIDKGVEITFAPGRTLISDLGVRKSKEFIEKLRPNANFRQRFEREIGVTLLHFACATFDVDLAKEMINQGADVNAQTHERSPFWPGYTPLHVLGSCTIRIDMIQLEPLVALLLSHGAQVILKNVQEETPIHLFYSNAERYFHNKMMERLLEAQTNFNVNPTNRMGLSHFHIACAMDCDKVIKQFIDHKVDINGQIDYFDINNDGGCSPLHLAVTCGTKRSYDLILKYGPDLRLADRFGNTPLHCATHCPYEECSVLVEKMTSAGADIMAINVYGETPFEELLQSSRISEEKIEMIMNNQGIRVNSFNPVNEEGYLALAFYGNFTFTREGVRLGPVFDVLMARNDITAIDDMGRNAIHNLVSSTDKPYSLSSHCIIENYTSAIYRLTRMGCDVDLRDKKGRTPLHISTQLKNADGIVALFDCGANVNIKDENEKTALDYTLEYIEDEDYLKIMWIFNAYLSKFCSYGFELSEVNVKLYRKVCDICETYDKDRESEYEVPIAHDEIEKLKEWRIGSSSMKLYDLLKNEGVTAYTVMKRDDRLAVDGIFLSDRLRKEVPKTTGLLSLRYNQARINLQTRLTLIEPAKVTLNVLGCCAVPDVCACIIFDFLTVKELQNMIASVFDIE